MGKRDKRWKKRVYPDSIYPDNVINKLLLDAESTNFLLGHDKDYLNKQVFSDNQISSIPNNIVCPEIDEKERSLSYIFITNVLSKFSISINFNNLTQKLNIGFKENPYDIRTIVASFTRELLTRGFVNYDLSIIYNNILFLLSSILDTFIREFVEPSLHNLNMSYFMTQVLEQKSNLKWRELVYTIRNSDGMAYDDFTTILMLVLATDEKIEPKLIGTFSREFIETFFRAWINIGPIRTD